MLRKAIGKAAVPAEGAMKITLFQFSDRELALCLWAVRKLSKMRPSNEQTSALYVNDW
jgi:hypothetical protein